MAAGPGAWAGDIGIRHSRSAGIRESRVMPHLRMEGSAIDMTIAGVAQANGCVVVADNEGLFEGLAIVNPRRFGG